MSMIVSLIAGVFAFVKKPLAVLPALLAGLLQVAALFVVIQPLFGLLLDLSAGGLPNAGFLELPYVLFLQHPTEIMLVLALALFGTTLQAWLVFVYGNLFGTKEHGILESVRRSLARLPRAFTYAVFLFALGFLYLLASLLLWQLLKPAMNFSGALFLAWLLLGYYVYLKLLFTPVAMAVEDLKLREGLRASWKFTRGKLLPLFLLTVLLGSVSSLLGATGDLIANGIEDDNAGLFAVLLFLALATAYTQTVLVKYWVVGRAK